MFKHRFVFLTLSLNNEFGRYCIVGGIAFVVDFGLLFLLTDIFGVYYLVSAVIGFLSGLVTNYLLSIYWVFTTRSVQSVVLERVMFMATGIIGLVITVISLWLFTTVIGVYYLIAKLLATSLTLCWNYFIRKMVLFS